VPKLQYDLGNSADTTFHRVFKCLHGLFKAITGIILYPLADQLHSTTNAAVNCVTSAGSIVSLHSACLTLTSPSQTHSQVTVSTQTREQIWVQRTLCPRSICLTKTGRLYSHGLRCAGSGQSPVVGSMSDMKPIMSQVPASAVPTNVYRA
jgi:hypothetical protein